MPETDSESRKEGQLVHITEDELFERVSAKYEAKGESVHADTRASIEKTLEYYKANGPDACNDELRRQMGEHMNAGDEGRKIFYLLSYLHSCFNSILQERASSGQPAE